MTEIQGIGINNRPKVAERAPPWWITSVIILSGLRLILSSDRDIVALNFPHDDYWYITRALGPLFGGYYDHMTLIHLPVYALWLSIIKDFGIPARLGIDIAWLLASGYLAFALKHLIQGAWLALLAYAYLAFHPSVLVIFDRALAETFLTVLATLTLAAGIDLWNSRHAQSGKRYRLACVLFPFSFALAFHTREEGIVLFAPLVFIAGFLLLAQRHWWSTHEGRRMFLMPFLVNPTIAVVVLGIALAGVNYFRYGVFARYDLAADGYQRAMAALIAIDVGPTPRHVTVTREMLARAYQSSRTFSELRLFLNDRTFWTRISEYSEGVPNEIANGWFRWALRDAAAIAGWHRNAVLANHKYAAVADELEQAFVAEYIKKRSFVLSSFLDPDYAKWLPDLPSSLVNVFWLFLDTEKQQLVGTLNENASNEQFATYVRAGGRRRARASLHISGWVIMPPDTLIGLGTSQTPSTWALLTGNQRPDVPGAYPFELTALENQFVSELVIRSPEGKTGSIPLNMIHKGHVSHFEGEVLAPVGIDELHIPTKQRIADLLVAPLSIAYHWIGAFFAVTILLGGMASVFSRDLRSSSKLTILVVAAIAIFVRAILFGIIDASSWIGTQERYMLPVLSAFACAATLGLYFLLPFCRVVYSKLLLHWRESIHFLFQRNRAGKNRNP